MIKKITLPIKKTTLLVLFLFLTVVSYSQTIWGEDFSSYSNGTITSAKWTLTTTAGINSGGNNYFQVRNSYFEGRDTNGVEQIFSTEVIDISAYTNVNLSLDAFKTGGGMEGGDYVKIYYKLNGGAETYFSTNGNNLAEFGTVIAQQTGLNGSTIQIVIKLQNGTGNSEIYAFDNILVQGTLIASGPEINVTDNDGTPTNILDGDNTPTVAKSTYFGDVFYNSGNNPNSFIIENNGTTDLTVNSVVSSNATEFAVTGTTSGVITPGNSIIFTITFDPTTIGTKTAVITILSNDVDEATYTFNVEGVGVDYCAANGNSTADEYINRVQLNTIDNNLSGAGTTSTGYSDFTAQSTDLTLGTSNTITITPTWTGTNYNEGYSVWIDYNQDGDFSDAGEQVWTNAPSQTNPVSGSFTVPGSATTGTTRMRVSLKWNGVPTPCESFGYGEVEDYTINIVSACTPPSAPTVSTDVSICNGNSTNLVGTSAGNTINWFTVSSGGTSIGSSASGANYSVSPSSTTTYYAEADDAGCISNTRTPIVVTVNDVPAQPNAISGNASVCQGSSETYSVTNVSGVTYNWTLPSGWTQTGGGTTNSITVTVGSGSGNIQVTPSNSCGNGTVSSLAVTSSNVPAQPSSITGNTNVCVGGSETYFVTNVSGVTYNWTFPSGWSQTAGGTTNSITVTVGSGSGNIQVTPSNSCGNGSPILLAVTSSVGPAQPSVISGNASVCEGNSETYSVANVSGVSYNWTFPAGWSQTAGGTTNSITVTVGSGSGNVEVTPSNGTCNGMSRTLAVSSSDIPAQPSTISGNINVCDGATETYSVTNVVGETYNWTVPTGWTINSGNGTSSITVGIVGLTSGNIEVTPSNSCGIGTLRSLAVSSSAISQPSTITGNTIVCEGSTETYSIVNVSGLSYAWTLPTGWVQTAGGTSNSITVTVGSGSGNIEVTPSNSCGSGPTRLLAVTSNAIPTITGTTPGSRNGPGTVVLNAETSITGSTVSLYANAVGGVALNSAIDLGPGLGADLTTPGIITTTTFYVDASNGPCFSTPRVAVIATVNYSEITVFGNGNIILDEDSTPITTDYTNLGSSPIAVGLTRSYTIQNSGTIDLTIGTINITGVDASEFVVTLAPAATLTPTGGTSSTTFSITFTPTALGTRYANVSFVTNDPDEDPFNFDIVGTGSTGLYPEINLQGNGNNIVDGYAGTKTSDGTNFGSVTIPGTIVKTFTIQNTGTGPLLLTGLPIVKITGSGYFSVTSQPSSSTIAAGGSLTFQITFNPSITGTFDAIVSIDNNDADENVYDFAIKGSATVSGREIDIQGNEISIVDGDTTPSVLDQTNFGITDTSTPIPHTFNIYSLGSSSLTINSTVSITGANAGLFLATAIPTTNLGVGAVTSFVVTFNPTASLGIKTATITISNNDSDEGTYNFDISAEVQSIPVQTVAPGGVTSNLKFWLKANSNIGSVSDNTKINTWYDQTFGSTKNAISKSLKEPKFQNNTSYNVNFNPVVHFDGNNYMSGGQGFNNSDMFIVLKPTNNIDYTTSPMDIYCGDDITTNRGSQDVTGIEMGNTSARHSNELFAYNQGAETSYGISEISTTKFYAGANIFNTRKHATYPSVKMDILNNGNTLPTSTANNTSYLDIVNSRYWLGRSEFWDASYNGDILEVINYNTRNNDTDKRKIETYLAIKYGITLGVNGTSVDYKDSGNTIIYDAGASYNYNIAGIGRDDKSELNQKQSKTENSTNDITIGLGNIYDTNSNNPNSFANDKDFLVWGHNNNTLAAQSPIVVNISGGPEITPSLTTNVNFISIGRTWRVIESGGNVPSCKVSVPSSMLTATITPPGDFLMFISDNPVFNPTAEYRIMNLNGANLEANYDFNGTKYITFGYAPEKIFTRSIQFDGVQDYLDAGDVLDLNPSEFTISAWIKRGSSSANKSIVSKRNAAYSNGGYDFKITTAGKVELSWKNGSAYTITSNTTIPTNVWHQVAVIYDGTNAKLYIDGVLDKTTPLGAPIAPTSNSESFIIAAAASTSTTAFFDGNIDEVRVWDKALAEAELHFIMNQEIDDNFTNATLFGLYFLSNGITPSKNDIAAVPWSNLKGYYPMSTYTYTNLKDASGNGNTAALRNLNSVDYQTAPLPYVSVANTNWDTPTTWNANSFQTIPGAASLVNSAITVDWNIVQISSNVTMNNTALPAANYGNRNVLGLIVDNSKELTAEGVTNMLNGTATGNGITVTHYLGLNGKIDLEGGSQLIQTTDSDLVTTATGELERDQQGTANSFNYNYWSSSVGAKGAGSTNTSYTVKGVLFDGRVSVSPVPITNFGTSPYFADSAPSGILKVSSYWLWKFNGPNDDYDAWIKINESTLLNPGEGYTMKGSLGNVAITTNQNYTFRGKPNNGDIMLPLTAGNDRLVGNPYPSSIDVVKFIEDNTSAVDGGNNTVNVFNGAVYFWDHFGEENSHNLRDYVGGYATRNKLTGTAAISNDARINANSAPGSKIPGQYIPVSQGFFVNTLPTAIPISGTNSIIFKNSQRVFSRESSGVSTFMKPSKKSNLSSKTSPNVENKTNSEIPIIRLIFNSPKGYHRQIAIGISEKASNEFDFGYDAFMPDVGIEDMYWILNEGKFVIQGVNNFNEDQELPLGIVISEAGLASIKLENLENLEENFELYIKDNIDGETYNITQNAFEINLDAGEYLDRFMLVFKPRLLTLQETTLTEGIHTRMNNSISELQIEKIVDTKIISINLYNYLGQLINSWESNLEERFIYLPISTSTGVYFVQINTSDGVLNKKIIIE